MADSTEPPVGGAGEGKTFTQAELDRIVQDRLAKEKGKYSDYDDLKAKAQRLDESEAANKSEVDRLKDDNAQLKQSKAESDAKLLRFEVAAAKGLKPGQAKRLVGSTREELEADADEMLADDPSAAGGAPAPAGGAAPAPGTGAPMPPPGGTPKPNLQGGSDPTEGGGDVDIRKVVESIPRG